MDECGGAAKAALFGRVSGMHQRLPLGKERWPCWVTIFQSDFP